jgi:hypothetical protein
MKLLDMLDGQNKILKSTPKLLKCPHKMTHCLNKSRTQAYKIFKIQARKIVQKFSNFIILQ